MVRVRSLGCLIVVVPLVLGCGANKVVVKGTVHVDGKPADDGSINFAPMDGQGPSTGGKIDNGTYELQGAAAVTPGTKRVSIVPIRKTGRRIPAGQPLPPGTMIDEIFAYPDLSDLNRNVLVNVEVVAGKINELEKKRGQTRLLLTIAPAWSSVCRMPRAARAS